MPVLRRASLNLFLILGAAAVLSPFVLASGSSPSDPGDQCVNTEVSLIGGPLAIVPHLGDSLGFELTENTVGDGATLGVFLVPASCDLPIIAPTSLGNLTNGGQQTLTGQPQNLPLP
jgi:hypothetical protein